MNHDIQGPRPGSYAWRDPDPGPQFRVSQLRRRRDIAMTIDHRALCQAIPPVHLCGAGGGCSGIKPGLKRQHAPGVPAAARGSAHPCIIETYQHSFDYDFPMRAIICSFYHEWIHVSYLRGAPIYYSCNVTLKNVLILIYPIPKRLNAEINFPCSETVR